MTTKEELDEAICLLNMKAKDAEMYELFPSLKCYKTALTILTKYRDGQLVEKGNSLSQKLKIAVVSTYRKIGGEKGMLLKGKNSYTGNEIADEIENETELGIDVLGALLNLAIDLVKRDKRNLPTPPTNQTEAAEQMHHADCQCEECFRREREG